MEQEEHLTIWLFSSQWNEFKCCKVIWRTNATCQDIESWENMFNLYAHLNTHEPLHPNIESFYLVLPNFNSEELL